MGVKISDDERRDEGVQLQGQDMSEVMPSLWDGMVNVYEA